MSRSMPIGVDNYKDLRSKYYFVDKTFVIKDIIDGHSEATLITRPRRFGKTLMLSMIEYFFSVDLKKESNGLFTDTIIESAGETYMAIQGTCPVINFSLKDCKGTTFEEVLGRVSKVMKDLYAKYKYIADGGFLTEKEKEQYRAIMDGTRDRETLYEAPMELIGYLHRFYNKQVILLIDEYDVIAQQGYSGKFYERAINFTRSMLSPLLKGNPHLDFAIVTGVLRIAKESIFSGLNKLDVCTVLSKSYSDCCGFTSEEIKTMAEDLDISEKLPEIKQWYDGYCFGNKEIYNPWSVINYVKDACEPGAYWVNTSENAIIKSLLMKTDVSRAKQLKSLVEGNTVVSSIRDSLIYDELHKNESAIYGMLLTTGYLTVSRKATELGDSFYELRIPNREINTAFVEEILDSLTAQDISNDYAYIWRAIITGDAESFSESMSNILRAMASSFDVGGKEYFYHGLVLGITATVLGKDYRVESNRESGYGRFDLAVIPNDRKNTGVIMEFKVAAESESLSAKAAEALAQIDEKRYIENMAAEGINNVWKYGIAFRGKDIQISVGKE